MAELLELSAKYIDAGTTGGERPNRVTQQLSEIADGVALVESFSHVVAFDTGDGLVLFDASLQATGPACVAALRGWSDAPVAALVYTHGHVDHVGGATAVVADAEGRGHARPSVIAHEAVPARFDRYDLTNGYNGVINARQFGGGRGGIGGGAFLSDWVQPDTTFDDTHDLVVGGLRAELRHARGETDDHLWAWIPDTRTIVTGDFLTWVFPNAGNPQKVQRYPIDWARALRAMAAENPELLLPAHGLPIGGADRIAAVLDDVARALEHLVDQTLAMMNEGRPLDEIVGAVGVPADLADKPYLPATYDEPEFVVRNIWRQFGGWYDGNPAHLKPAREASIAAEVADLAGGADRLAARAEELAGADQPDDEALRLACHLIEMAVRATPDDRAVHGARARVYAVRRAHERSLMSRGIYGWAAGESSAIAEPDADTTN